MGDDTKISRKRKSKGKKFNTLADRLHHIYGKEAKTYTLRKNRLFKDGMNFENRKCTDKICLTLFWIMLASKVFFFYYGYTNGNINRVLCGVDGAGNQCGVGPFKDYPKVYFSNITTNQTSHIKDIDQIFNSGLCVKECPYGNNVTCMPNNQYNLDWSRPKW